MKIEFRKLWMVFLLASLLLAAPALWADEATLCDNVDVSISQNGTTTVYNGNDVPITFNLQIRASGPCVCPYTSTYDQVVLQPDDYLDFEFIPDDIHIICPMCVVCDAQGYQAVVTIPSQDCRVRAELAPTACRGRINMPE